MRGKLASSSGLSTTIKDIFSYLDNAADEVLEAH